MFRFGIVAFLPLLGGCTVEATSFAHPIRIEWEQRTVVIENLNRPFDCRVVAEDAIFPATYAVVYGPTQRADAVDFVRKTCRRRR